MACTQKLLLASLFLLSVFHEGWAQVCTTSSLSVSQKTSNVDRVSVTYEVEVSNSCICSQSSVLLRCTGFNSTVPVDPDVFRPAGDGLCVVNNNMPVFQGQPIQFKYTWTSKFDLSVDSSTINCS